MYDWKLFFFFQKWDISNNYVHVWCKNNILTLILYKKEKIKIIRLRRLIKSYHENGVDVKGVTTPQCV